MAKAQKIKEDSSEEKIKEAARTVFMKKGYAATRTRDIAEAAGINLALLNYYFRSKEKLYGIIMQEKMGSFFGHMLPVLLNPHSTLDSKIQSIVNNYIDLLQDNPDLPLFVLNAMRNNPEEFTKMVKGATSLLHSAFSSQLKEMNPKVAPEHFFINIMALCIFPFAMRPGLITISPFIAENFNQLMDERKTLIPKWAKAMIKAK